MEKEIRIFRRELLINDPAPEFTVPRAEREAVLWAKRCDGRRVEFEPGGYNGLSVVPDGEIIPYMIARSWTEPIGAEEGDN